MNEEQTIQAKKLIAQQLPDLEKWNKLHQSVEARASKAAGTKPTFPDVSRHELGIYHNELKNKLMELLSTPYTTDLYLLLLPFLIEIKETGSKDS